jgi:hypothetical protein
MPMRLRRDEGQLFRLDLQGTLRRDEFLQCQRALAREMDGGATVRLLVILDRFEGWDARDDWRDLSFYVTYGDAIDRIAIVGPESWRAEMLMFAGAELRKAPVEFFAEDRLAQAGVWLGAGVGSTGSKTI